MDYSSSSCTAFEDAHRRAAARELREETGIDVPPARLMDTAVRRKNREYFFLELRDADGAGPDRDHANAENPFTLALSGEHTGFTFERDLAKAEDMIRLHSGGENALALRALRGDHGDTRALLGLAVGGVPHNAEPAVFKKRLEKGLFEPGDPADYCC